MKFDINILRIYSGTQLKYEEVRFGFEILSIRKGALLAIHTYRNERPKKKNPTIFKWFLTISIFYFNFDFRIGEFKKGTNE